MYDIFFTKISKKQLDRLEQKARERILLALEKIRIRPAAHLKKLSGNMGYRLRVGDYRVIMDIDNGMLIITIIKIGHRKKVHRR